MKDQPFKKYFPVDRPKSRQNYRYPTYQHYYQSKVSRLNLKLSPKKQLPFHSEKKLAEPEQTKEVPSPALNKTPSKVNLKNELQILKLQVQRIMEKKQGILKSQVERKGYHSPDKMNAQVVESPRKSESDDNQSVNSQKVINQPLKRLELHRTTENYDHQQYLQLQNNLLKTQLRNLKNKYLNKKKELYEKCQVLEKKVAFLETSLFKSQQSLEAEVTSLKDSLRIFQSEGASQLIPTSDKIKSMSELSPKKESSSNDQPELLKQKLKKLYEQIASKNKQIYEKDIRIEDLQNQVSRIKKQSSFASQKSKSVIRELDQIKKIYNSNSQKLVQRQLKVQELQMALQSERFGKYNDNNNSLNLFEERLKSLKEEYESKLKLIDSEFQQKMAENKILNQQKMIIEKQHTFLKAQFKEQEHRLSALNSKLKEQKANSQQIQERYLKILQRTEKKQEEMLSNIHKQYQSKVLVLSKKDSKSYKQEPIQKTNSQKKAALPTFSNQPNTAQQKELRKWKIQYKQLKQKYQHYLRTETSKKLQFKQYYKNYRQYKQKVQVATHKLKLFQREFQKYLTLLTEKENELLHKEIQFRKYKNEHQLQKTVYLNENQALTQKCKSLQEKLGQQAQKVENQQKYRKQVEQKIFTSGVTDESLKEVVERMKKRLVEQDQKFGKMIKQTKNKQSLTAKLKQELRDVMENMEKKLAQQKINEIKEITDTYLKRQLDSFKEWKKRAQEQHKILAQSNEKLISQIQQLKMTIVQKEQSVDFAQKELNTIIHSYNLKNIELNEMAEQREKLLQNFSLQVQEMDQVRSSIQKIFQEEIMMKNEQITSTRAELAAKKIGGHENKYFSSTFDDILKSNMEENKKLRDQITKKTQQIFRLRDNFSTLRSQYEHLKAEIQISKLKTMAEKKNLQVNFQIETQNIKNELDMSEKKAISLEQKIKLIIEQNKKKDSFIQTYIVGKKLPQTQKDLVTTFIKQYQITIGSSDIVARLAAETQHIQKLNQYNHNLLKETSILREQLLAYQAIDEERVSVFDSKVSKYSINSSEIKEELNEDVELFDIQDRKEKGSESKLRKTESLQQFIVLEHDF